MFDAYFFRKAGNALHVKIASYGDKSIAARPSGYYKKLSNCVATFFYEEFRDIY